MYRYTPMNKHDSERLIVTAVRGWSVGERTATFH